MTTPLFTLGFSNNGPQPRIQNVYQLTDNFSKVWGHHTIKAGLNIDRPGIDNPFYNSSAATSASTALEFFPPETGLWTFCSGSRTPMRKAADQLCPPKRVKSMRMFRISGNLGRT